MSTGKPRRLHRQAGQAGRHKTYLLPRLTTVTDVILPKMYRPNILIGEVLVKKQFDILKNFKNILLLIRAF